MFKQIGAALATAVACLLAVSASAQTPLTATVGASFLQPLSSGFADSAIVTFGSLPPGLGIGSLSFGSGRAITGVPETQGTYDFTIESRTCSSPQSCSTPTSTNYRMTVAALPQTTLSNAQVGVPFTQSLGSSAPGAGSVSLVGGSLPPGLTISTINPPFGGTALTGTPTTAGEYVYQIRTTSGFCFPSCTSQTTEYNLRVVSAPAPVPTMTEWAMILFGAVLAGGAALHIQRRRFTA